MPMTDDETAWLETIAKRVNIARGADGSLATPAGQEVVRPAGCSIDKPGTSTSTIYSSKARQEAQSGGVLEASTGRLSTPTTGPREMGQCWQMRDAAR